MASVFYPSPVQAAINLRTATLFTRINVRADPQRVNAALAAAPNVQNTFSLAHLSDILVFDSVKEQHTPHVKAVLQMLRDNKLYIDTKRCAFDQPSWTEAGFWIEPVNEKAECFMVLLREQVREAEPKAESKVGSKPEIENENTLDNKLDGSEATATNTKAAKNKKKNDKRKEKKEKAKRDAEAQGTAEEEPGDGA